MSSIMDFLKKNSLFAHLDDTQLIEVANLASEKSFSEGEIIIHEGQKADVFYIIKDGALEVSKKERITNAEYIVATLTRGEIVGEIGLLTNESRIATVRVTKPSNLIQYSIADFQNKLSETTHSIIKQNIYKILIERLAYSYDNTIVTLKSKVEYAKKRHFIQTVSIIVLATLLMQIGITFYYYFNSEKICNTITTTNRQVGR